MFPPLTWAAQSGPLFSFCGRPARNTLFLPQIFRDLFGGQLRARQRNRIEPHQRSQKGFGKLLHG